MLPPTTLKANYFPQFKDWLGTQLKDQELAQLLPRPLPPFCPLYTDEPRISRKLPFC